MDFVVAQVIGKKYSAVFGFESEGLERRGDNSKGSGRQEEVIKPRSLCP